MKLTKYKLGDLIEQIEERNVELKYGPELVKGMTLTKEIIPTKANLKGADLSKYYIVGKNEFIYNPRTHGKKIGLGFNNTNQTILISWNNIAFRVKKEKKDIILPEYLFLDFNREEWDRYACINSWGSSTEVFSWDEMCDIEITLPDIETQQKYVDIYNSMLRNQMSYERGLEDLKLVCDAYMDRLKNQSEIRRKLKPFIEELNFRNKDLKTNKIRGVGNIGEFIQTKANTIGLNLSNYKIVSSNNFAYNPSRINIGSIALLKEEECIVSPMYITFKLKEDSGINPDYLMMWFERKEFQRSTLFYATGSVRDTFSFDLMGETKVPIPSMEVQKSIANIYKVYKNRKMINEKLKQQLKDICPILIKGSLQD